MDIRSILLSMLATLSVSALANADPVKGKQLHDQKCISCHAERFGGDGSKIYLRTDRLIHNRAALDQRVAMCSTQTNAGWLPDEEANVTEYLATRYYKFNPQAGKK